MNKLRTQLKDLIKELRGSEYPDPCISDLMKAKLWLPVNWKKFW